MHTLSHKFLALLFYFPGTYQFSSLESAPLGSSLGRIKANDPDMGENAEIEYSIAPGDGSDVFDIITDKDTQEGIITVKKVYFSSFSFIGLSTPGLRVCVFSQTGGRRRFPVRSAAEKLAYYVCSSSFHCQVTVKLQNLWCGFFCFVLSMSVHL